MFDAFFEAGEEGEGEEAGRESEAREELIERAAGRRTAPATGLGGTVRMGARGYLTPPMRSLRPTKPVVHARESMTPERGTPLLAPFKSPECGGVHTCQGGGAPPSGW